MDKNFIFGNKKLIIEPKKKVLANVYFNKPTSSKYTNEFKNLCQLINKELSQHYNEHKTRMYWYIKNDSALNKIKKLSENYVPNNENHTLEEKLSIQSNMQSSGSSNVLAEEVVNPEEYFEGATKKISVNTYERSIDARTECLEHYGYSCSVCKFNFNEVFGELGKSFIHVHHLKKLSEIGQEYQLIPIKDLRPVCPNCHSMLHRRKPALSIDELIQIRKCSLSDEH